MSTIHNPVNFDPTQYVIVDYFDNKPPEYVLGMDLEVWQRWREAHRREMEALFLSKNCSAHRCTHCGNGTVRYVVAADHIPTGQRVCFGDICVHRLSIPNASEFRMKCIRSKASTEAKRVALFKKRLAFLEAHPDIQQAVNDISKPEHAKNGFAQDVLSKLETYGELSERQISCVLTSMERDRKWAAERAQRVANPAAIAPSGRVTVTGTIVKFKTQHSEFYGDTFKMIVELESGAKVYCTIPSEHVQDRRIGDKITFAVTLEPSKDDPSFAFGKRPVIKSVSAVKQLQVS
jgi:hypothetical protein